MREGALRREWIAYGKRGFLHANRDPVRQKRCPNSRDPLTRKKACCFEDSHDDCYHFRWFVIANSSFVKLLGLIHRDSTVRGINPGEDPEINTRNSSLQAKLGVRIATYQVRHKSVCCSYGILAPSI